MGERGALDDVVWRMKANLKTPRRIETPLGRVDLREDIVVRTDLREAALSATLEARKGRFLFARLREITIELVALDDAGTPASAERLRDPIGRCERRVGVMLDREAALAVYSPSGWDAGALAYARNDPPGSGYAGRKVHLVLVGPAASDVVMSAHDELAQSLRPVLRGLTDQEEEARARAALEEEEARAREALNKELTLKGYAVIELVASGSGLDPARLEEVARRMAGGDGTLIVSEGPDGQPVLRKRE